MDTQLLDLMKHRRTIYNLGRNVQIPQAELYQYIKAVIRHTPSAFNSQPVRAVVLFNDNHEKLWDIVETALEEKVAPDAFLRTKAKISSFRDAFASILFYTDMDVVQAYADNPHLATYQYQEYNWAEEAQGNAQFAVWTGLEENGLGVNIQHYDPLINSAVAAQFDIPASWQLRAEMNFGSIEKPAAEKEFMDDDQRFKVFD
ncbi:nitroreductase family protein [Fructilactobacillus carniphilus]|uniref:Nitroreductase family protein n=1 Tax=Fructilactobacillus carniphilus TaxID=2940297 RepID=A0ABY5BX03_9LACO|nr:nitroreductase family protein [Fructilactobacillus carniphilus]USS90329.1 nitroreductase family protein [Fructilactobacillus carniphilus]